MVRLTTRERLLAGGLAVAVGVWLLYAVAIKPTCRRIRTLERVIPEKQAELHTLQAKSVEYAALRKDFEDFRAGAGTQDPDFQLLPYLEKLIKKHGLDRNLADMAPHTVEVEPGYSETVVRIVLQGISLKQLVGLLKEIEASEACAQIGSLHIHRDPEVAMLLDSTVEIHSAQSGRSGLAMGLDERR
jgi:type II secretory pathway component PulM